jgi:glutathione synthase/RimK-type ligase-like ATP-grasp enzyme
MAERIVLVTCATWPDLSISDQCLATALQRRGSMVDVTPWNGPREPFSHPGAVVLRAAWDYHTAPDEYRHWLGHLDPVRTFNPPALVRWNLDKSYLLELATRGAALPRSAVVRADPAAVAEALQMLQVTDAVIKPTIGASGFGVERLRPGDEAAALCRLLAGKSREHLLVQEFMPEISAGELAGVFFDGVFSHGFRRVPAHEEFRVNSQYGGRAEPAILTDDTIRQMAAILELLPLPPLYARIDGVLRGERFVLMEVEVNEPGLCLHLAPGAGERFAEALLARLSA